LKNEEIEMEKHIVRILDTEKLNYNVKRLRVEKPDGYDFKPGQATELAINDPDWKEEGRPFTFTSLPDDPFLEFVIKIYPDHNGVTNEIKKLERGDELILSEVFGAIQYKTAGTFIAGGAGVTPFIAILRKLRKDGELKGNKLVFANRMNKDIFLFNEFRDMLNDNFINILSEEEHPDYHYGLLTKAFLRNEIEDTGQSFYVCGPPEMMDSVIKSLKELEIPENNIVQEEF
jgi:hypothetical protein